MFVRADTKKTNKCSQHLQNVCKLALLDGVNAVAETEN